MFDTVVYSPVLLKSSLAEMLIRRLNAQGVRRQRLSPEQFRSISTTERATASERSSASIGRRSLALRQIADYAGS